MTHTENVFLLREIQSNKFIRSFGFYPELTDSIAKAKQYKTRKTAESAAKRINEERSEYCSVKVDGDWKPGKIIAEEYTITYQSI